MKHAIYLYLTLWYDTVKGDIISPKHPFIRCAPRADIHSGGYIAVAGGVRIFILYSGDRTTIGGTGDGNEDRFVPWAVRSRKTNVTIVNFGGLTTITVRNPATVISYVLYAESNESRGDWYENNNDTKTETPFWYF